MDYRILHTIRVINDLTLEDVRLKTGASISYLHGIENGRGAPDTKYEPIIKSFIKKQAPAALKNLDNLRMKILLVWKE
jgi:cytoskeletal protein RodZ